MLFLLHYLKFLSGSGVNCLQTGPSSSGAPNRPLPPTPDEEESGDRTLVMKRVSARSMSFAVSSLQSDVSYESVVLSLLTGGKIDRV
jgi:hypothetical protein